MKHDSCSSQKNTFKSKLLDQKETSESQFREKFTAVSAISTEIIDLKQKKAIRNKEYYKTNRSEILKSRKDFYHKNRSNISIQRKKRRLIKKEIARNHILVRLRDQYYSSLARQSNIQQKANAAKKLIKKYDAFETEI